MPAIFTNAQRGSDLVDTENHPPPRRKVIYASWDADELGLAKTWIDGFKARLDAFDEELESRVSSEPPEAGTKVVQQREQIAEQLRDVTDFVVVATMPYLAAQRREMKANSVTDLSWMLESIETGGNTSCWLAPLERAIRLNCSIGPHRLSEFRGWHTLKATEDLSEPFTFFSKEDLAKKAQFADELNGAISRIADHDEHCSICSALHKR